MPALAELGICAGLGQLQRRRGFARIEPVRPSAKRRVRQECSVRLAQFPQLFFAVLIVKVCRAEDVAEPRSTRCEIVNGVEIGSHMTQTECELRSRFVRIRLTGLWSPICSSASSRESCTAQSSPAPERAAAPPAIKLSIGSTSRYCEPATAARSFSINAFRQGHSACTQSAMFVPRWGAERKTTRRMLSRIVRGFTVASPSTTIGSSSFSFAKSKSSRRMSSPPVECPTRHTSSPLAIEPRAKRLARYRCNSAARVATAVVGKLSK